MKSKWIKRLNWVFQGAQWGIIVGHAGLMGYFCFPMKAYLAFACLVMPVFMAFFLGFDMGQSRAYKAFLRKLDSYSDTEAVDEAPRGSV